MSLLVSSSKEIKYYAIPVYDSNGASFAHYMVVCHYSDKEAIDLAISLIDDIYGSIDERAVSLTNTDIINVFNCSTPKVYINCNNIDKYTDAGIDCYNNTCPKKCELYEMR